MPRTQAAVPASALPRLLERAAAAPWQHDLFMLLRWLDARHRTAPRLGTARRPGEECVRLGQKVSLQFAPANIASIAVDGKGHVVVQQRGFGLFGPNGPMPIHLTEYVMERNENHRDHSLSAFADIFHHRFLLLFYRAWASVQPTVAMDRRTDDDFARYVGSTMGIGQASLRGRDSVPERAKLFNAGPFVRQTRNPEGLLSALKGFFGCRFALEERRLQWLRLRPEDCTALGAGGPRARLGQGAVCGIAAPDRHGCFRLRAGPLDLAAYERFLPIGSRYRQVRDWVRNYIGLEFQWDFCLVLRADSVPRTTLGGTTRLGWTSWLGKRRTGEDADDLILDVEAGCRC